MFSHAQRCVDAKDYRDWRYLNKRSLFLAALLPLLARAVPAVIPHYEWFHGDFDKPALVLPLPPAVCPHGVSLRLLPALPAGRFPAERLAPEAANVRSASIPAGPTWFYNSTVLEDLLFPHYAEWLRGATTRAPALPTAGNIVRVGETGNPEG